MVLRAMVFAVVLSGCLPKVAPQRLEQPAALALAIVVDDDVQVPEAFRARLKDVAQSRNLEVREVQVAQLQGQRLTAERFAALRAASDAPFALLVEARTRFFSQIEGRFRWSVPVKLTAARAGASPSQDAVDLPALLQFEHERGSEALENVAEPLASRVAPLLDGILVGAADAGVLAPAAGAAPAGAQ